MIPGWESALSAARECPHLHYFSACPAVALQSRWRDELPLLWRLWRVSRDSLAGAGCGELVDRALHAVALAIALLRDPPVVIGRPRLQAAHAHAENSLWMGP